MIRPCRHLRILSGLLMVAISLLSSGAAHAVHFLEADTVAHPKPRQASKHNEPHHGADHEADHCAVCIQLATLSRFLLTDVAVTFAAFDELARFHIDSVPPMRSSVADPTAALPRAPPLR